MPNSNILHEAHAAARATDPDTSHMAGDSVRVNEHRRLVMMQAKAFYANGIEEFTAKELEQALAPHFVSPSSARSRLKELELLDLIELTGEKTKINGAGRSHNLHRLTSAGHAYKL